jgi:cardiolipin synthase
MTIDGQWSAVGSANFDDRSFETNDEFTVGILDRATAERLDSIFERYAARACEIELEKWARRSPAHKFIDQLFYLFNEIL